VTPWIYAPQVGIVDTASPAYTEGLRTGDIITSINGEPIATVEQLERELERTRDTSLRLTYLRAKPVRGEPSSRPSGPDFGTYLWFESNHARLLRRHETGTATGLLPANTFLRHVEPDSPAARAGLTAGDRILAIDDKPVTRWERLREQLDRKGEQPLTLSVQSPGGMARTVTVTQEVVHYRGIYKQPQSYLRFGAEPYRSFDVPAPEPIRGRFTYALGSAVDETWANITTIWTALRQMVTLERGVDELSSVVGIFDVAGMAAEQGPGQFLRLMALLSINLGIVNLLPIPILDGGHLLFFTVEALRRRPLSQRAREIASAIGLVILLLLLLIALRNDLMRKFM
jgi:regulator of sigma E protease